MEELPKSGLLVLTLIGLLACSEVFLEDISDSEVFLLAPGDSAELVGDSVTLWWDFVEDASFYRVRLASPNLSNPVTLVADSFATTNNITFSLMPGEYEWEVSALNDGYSTDFFFRSFSLDSVAVEDIVDESVTLVAPVSGANLIGTGVALLWDPIAGVDHYRVRMVTPSFTQPVELVLDSLIAGTSLNLQVAQGTYEWSVYGENTRYQTQESQDFFSIDSVEVVDISGGSVNILSPSDQSSIISKTALFWWDELVGATEYEVIVVSPSLANPEAIILDSLARVNRIELEMDPGTYEMSVRGINSQFSTTASTSAFEIDSILVQDISGSVVMLTAPSAGVTASNGEINFFWEAVSGADEYTIRVVSGDFDSPDLLFVNESVTATQATFSLDSGSYIWGVRAVNRDFETDFSTRTLLVD